MNRRQDLNELEAMVRTDVPGATWARILAAGAVITALGFSGGPFFPMMLLGPLVTGVVVARRRCGWRAAAAAWAAGGIGMLVLEWIVSGEDQAFVVVLTLVMVGLVRLGHALGSVRLAGLVAR